MRLVHLSDTHLGFRQFTRLTRDGVNQREADVATTFRQAVTRIIELAPDVIVLGGDIFHVVRPANSAILTAFTEFSRLTQSLPNTLVVLVAGNHDTPRSTETGGILQLFTPLGIHVVDRAAQRLTFPERELSVLAVPDVPGLVRPPLEPDPAYRFNVMVMHGEVEGMLPTRHGERPASEIPADELNAPLWDYVALGHYHVYREIQPNVFYSGSIDYTSTNPWGEMQEERDAGLPGKGFAERDLVTGQQTFHALPSSRAHVDVPTFSAQGMTAEEVDAALRAAVDSCEGGIDGKVVRAKITGVPKDVGRMLDQYALRDYRHRALNFNLDIRRPEHVRVVTMRDGSRRFSLEERVRDFLGDRVLDKGISRDDFTALAFAYLDQTKPPEESDTELAELLEQSLAQEAKVA